MSPHELHPYERNPRRNDAAVTAVAESIRRFGFRSPIIVDGDHVIIAGHTRWKAARKLHLPKVPVIVADDLSEDEARAYRIADNSTADIAEWDLDLLGEEVMDLGMDLSGFGLDIAYPSEEEASRPSEASDPSFLKEEKYTTRIQPLVYTPTSETAPPISELADHRRTDALIADIEAADIPEDAKEFLRLAAYRHTVFDYGRIAEWYAHADPEVQDLMERSALVILDYDKAIEYGYAAMSRYLTELRERDAARSLRGPHPDPWEGRTHHDRSDPPEAGLLREDILCAGRRGPPDRGVPEDVP